MPSTLQPPLVPPLSDRSPDVRQSVELEADVRAEKAESVGVCSVDARGEKLESVGVCRLEVRGEKVESVGVCWVEANEGKEESLCI